MAVFCVIFGAIFSIVFGIISLIIRLIKKRINIFLTIVAFISMIVAIVGFCIVPAENSKYTMYSKNIKQESSKISNTNSNTTKKQFMLRIIENGESVLMQYNGKNILVDASKELNKSKEIFNILDKYNVKKVDSIIITSNDDNLSSNVSDLITRYNISDIRYSTNELNSKISDAAKAVNSVKENSNKMPQKIKDNDKIDGINIQVLKNEKLQKNIIFSINENCNINVVLDCDKMNGYSKNMYNHTIETSYNDNGTAIAELNINELKQ